jgi:hypothetical protein
MPERPECRNLRTNNKHLVFRTTKKFQLREHIRPFDRSDLIVIIPAKIIEPGSGIQHHGHTMFLNARTQAQQASHLFSLATAIPYNLKRDNKSWQNCPRLHSMQAPREHAQR